MESKTRVIEVMHSKHSALVRILLFEGYTEDDDAYFSKRGGYDVSGTEEYIKRKVAEDSKQAPEHLFAIDFPNGSFAYFRNGQAIAINEVWPSGSSTRKMV